MNGIVNLRVKGSVRIQMNSILDLYMSNLNLNRNLYLYIYIYRFFLLKLLEFTVLPYLPTSHTNKKSK